MERRIGASAAKDEHNFRITAMRQTHGGQVLNFSALFKSGQNRKIQDLTPSTLCGYCMAEIIDIFLHVDEHLAAFVQTHGKLVYGLLFAIIFCETGLVVTPFLPGDSLLFAAGALAGLGS